VPLLPSHHLLRLAGDGGVDERTVKSCPKCQRSFPNDAGFCPADGTPLVFSSMVPIAESSDDPRIGKRLAGRYELRRVVADGGMGRVYEGVDKQTDTRVAVKVLHDEVVQDEVALERFKREYEISAKLPHDHIVQVLDFQRDTAQTTWLLVMEFLDGEELRYILKREKYLAPERVIRMLSQVAIGLDEAHARHFIHRDLKPDNLFLCGTREGDTTKILDFGSVKDKSNQGKKLTVLGTTIGSPYYMSPEQAQGLDTLDARADVFAMAAVAYECLTGSVPFAGNNGPSILLAIMTKEPVPPSVKGKDAPLPPPPGLDNVIEEGLAKNQNIRTKSVGALADNLGHAYGLTGHHREWAVTPQQELARRLAEARPRVMQRAPVALEAAADPFAAPAAAQAMPPQGAMAMQGGGPVVGPPAGGYGGYGMSPPMQPGPAMDHAFAAARMDVPPTIPGLGARPPWLLPAIVGVAALVVGGLAALIVMMAK
jgi:eukaryotic-like serine/threonine-protein kinase